ncbi:hypothetical protein DL770_010160 [Monosporascus sp. CRB-9-2]|nr:hypothetical protein DL770_010160 [Monosporascus sp. CRB-9-2]
MSESVPLLPRAADAHLWAAMHVIYPYDVEFDPEGSRRHRAKARVIQFLSPPSRSTSDRRRFLLGLFYAVTHVFAFMNTLIYWGILVPSGHGGFKPPPFPQHPAPDGNASVTYDPDKGLFEEGSIKSFSILNLSLINSIIAAIEIFFLNSIRRPTPVAGHIGGVMLACALYLIWALIGQHLTGHAGIFFLDPDEMSGQVGAVIAACIAFISLSPGVFAFMYGLIAMRETMAAAPRNGGAA